MSEVWPFSLGNHLENTCHLAQSAQLQRRRESSRGSRTTVRQVKTILHSLCPAGPARCSATWGANGLLSVAPDTPHKHSPQLSLGSWWTRMLTQWSASSEQDLPLPVTSSPQCLQEGKKHLTKNVPEPTQITRLWHPSSLTLKNRSVQN